jgi:cytochrome c nitrite reductase small subunit
MTRQARRGLVLVGVCIGVVAGLGSYTFVYAKGASYLQNDPEACRNCHVMQGQFDAWTRSSHHAVAVCNDCHTPHDFIGKYTTKALNGWHHSLAFTLRKMDGPILIKERNRRVTERACRGCHGEIVQGIDTAHPRGGAMSCTRCHPNVGHLH